MSRHGKETRKTVGSQAARTVLDPDNDTVGKLAHELWQKRGCPVGSPQQDWFQAERALGGRKESSDSTTA
jgi:hypothetical protein